MKFIIATASLLTSLSAFPSASGDFSPLTRRADQVPAASAPNNSPSENGKTDRYWWGGGYPYWNYPYYYPSYPYWNYPYGPYWRSNVNGGEDQQPQNNPTF